MSSLPAFGYRSEPVRRKALTEPRKDGRQRFEVDRPRQGARRPLRGARRPATMPLEPASSMAQRRKAVRQISKIEPTRYIRSFVNKQPTPNQHASSSIRAFIGFPLEYRWASRPHRQKRGNNSTMPPWFAQISGPRVA
jgi:hypothetical protein